MQPASSFLVRNRCSFCGSPLGYLNSEILLRHLMVYAFRRMKRALHLYCFAWWMFYAIKVWFLWSRLTTTSVFNSCAWCEEMRQICCAVSWECLLLFTVLGWSWLKSPLYLATASLFLDGLLSTSTMLSYDTQANDWAANLHKKMTNESHLFLHFHAKTSLRKIPHRSGFHKTSQCDFTPAHLEVNTSCTNS